MSHQSSQYPNAYCVKCGTHTDTLHKHTVVLQNNSRALKGVCPACESEVYRVMPKIKAAEVRRPLTVAEKKKYPDAFCVKCQAHTPTTNAHTVMFDNNSRAVHGQCQHCASDVYRILGGKAAEAKVAAAVQGPVEQRRLPMLTRRAEEARAARQASLAQTWSYVAAAGVIVGIIAAFFVYAIL